MSQQLCQIISTFPQINCPSCGNIGVNISPSVNIEIMKLPNAQRPPVNCIYLCNVCLTNLCNLCSKNHYKNVHNIR